MHTWARYSLDGVVDTWLILNAETLRLNLKEVSVALMIYVCLCAGVYVCCFTVSGPLVRPQRAPGSLLLTTKLKIKVD